jgi:hypothetical protein
MPPVSHAPFPDPRGPRRAGGRPAARAGAPAGERAAAAAGLLLATALAVGAAPARATGDTAGLAATPATARSGVDSPERVGSASAGDAPRQGASATPDPAPRLAAPRTEAVRSEEPPGSPGLAAPRTSPGSPTSADSLAASDAPDGGRIVDPATLAERATTATTATTATASTDATTSINATTATNATMAIPVREATDPLAPAPAVAGRDTGVEPPLSVPSSEDPSSAPAGAGSAGAPAPGPAQAFEPVRDEALAAALASIVEQSHRAVRSYVQIGMGVRPSQAEAALAEAVRTGERAFATLHAGTGRRLAPARLRQLGLRWRALRDATATRPEPRIAALMDAVAAQVSELIDEPAGRLPPPGPAQRQRILLQRMAGGYLLRCWGAGAMAPDTMLSMRVEFGRLLDASTGAAPTPGGIDAATLRSQWGLLAGGLDRHGERCDATDLAQVASTSDRLAQLLDASPDRSAILRPR